MDVGSYLLVCLLSSLPGPPGVSYQDAYVQLFPVDKTKCPTINPVTDISYELYTSENPLQPDMLSLGNDDALQNSHFDFYKPTVLFFHAFFESSSAASALTIRTAYLQRKDHNVILLNARRMEAGPWYLTAARNTRVVGEYTAAFIDYLVSKGLYLPSLHLIGLSLGAQMAGVCGQNVKSGRIARITGLDPAGPLFTKWPRSLKLDRGDAEFVDVIHTDAGIFGYPTAIGHADFWPNQGISPQPGCRLEEVKLRNPGSVIESLFCSHWRSFMFYAESVVTPDSFASITCKNWNEYARGLCDRNQQPVNMGFNVDRNARGNYYSATRPASPFSQQTPLPKSNAPPPQPALHQQQLSPQQLELLQQIVPQQLGNHVVQKLEPQQLLYQELEPQQLVQLQQLAQQKLGAQQLVIEQLEQQKLEPQEIVYQQLGQQKLGPQVLVQQKLQPQHIVYQELAQQKLEPQQKLELQQIAYQELEPQQKLELQQVGYQQPKLRQHVQQNLEPQQVVDEQLEYQQQGQQKIQQLGYQQIKPQLKLQQAVYQQLEPQQHTQQKLEPQQLEYEQLEHQQQVQKKLEPQQIVYEQLDHQDQVQQKLEPQQLAHQQSEPRQILEPPRLVYQQLNHEQLAQQQLERQEQELIRQEQLVQQQFEPKRVPHQRASTPPETYLQYYFYK